MGQIKTKRNKAYRPRQVHIPVMPDLQRDFLFAGHGALAALRLAPNVHALDQLAAMFNVILVALVDTGRASIILESGMRALQEVANRFERTGAVAIGRYELAPIELALVECENLIKQLDVMGLYIAQKRLRAAEAIERLEAARSKVAA